MPQSDWENYLEARRPVHYIGTVTEASWMPSSLFFARDGQPSYRQDREESMFLVLGLQIEQCFEPADYSGFDPREYYSAGKELEWPTDGQRLLTDRKTNPNSKLAHLLDRLKGTSLLTQLQTKGSWRDASIWTGLRLEMRHEKIELGQFVMDIAVPSLASVPVPPATGESAGVQEGGATAPSPLPTGGSAIPHGPYALASGEIDVPVPMSVMEQIARETQGMDRTVALAHLNRADGPYRGNQALMIWAFQSEDFWALLAELEAQGAS